MFSGFYRKGRVLARSGGCLRGQGLPGRFHQASEGAGVVDRELGQDLAVDLDAGQPQALDETVVRHAVGAGGRVDARDPQLAEVALAVTAVAVGVLHRVEHLLLGLAVEPRTLTAVAARG